ncbi:MAG: type IX secretion system membrane protein PorP/SprF [Bacteroidota bacterium]
MRRFLLFTLVISGAWTVAAQQDVQYTQFMYNKLAYNPAYAGSLEAICATAIVRNQWLGLEGAPRSQVFSFDAPLSDNRVGLGLNIARNTIGISTNYNIDAAYAYRVSLGKGTIGVGLQGSVRSFNANYSDDRLVAIQNTGIDASIPVGQQNKMAPNFGAGVYYKEDKLYVGFSIPRLLENNIDFSEDETIISESVRHFYFMGGYVFDVNEKIQIQPQMLFKYTENTPFDLDFNMSAIFMEKYMVGATYRSGGSSRGLPAESIDLLFSTQINENFLFGISYDVTISEIRDYSSGSIEAMVRYCFKKKKSDEQEVEGDYLNPRFF